MFESIVMVSVRYIKWKKIAKIYEISLQSIRFFTFYDLQHSLPFLKISKEV